MWSAELGRLPQFDGISLRVMQTSEAPNVGIGFRVFDLNSCRSQLGYHFVEVMHSKVHHPDLLRVPEILGRFGKGTEDGRSGLLLPNGSALARWFERDPQVLQVPVPQRFGIMSTEEQPSDSGYFFHFRSSRFMFSSCLRRRSRTRWLCGVLSRHGEFIPGQNEAGPESIRQDLKYLAPFKAHSILLT